MKHTTAFITGAGSGLGKELAFILAKEKVSLLLTSKSLEELLFLEKELKPLTEVTIFPKDLTLEKDRLFLADVLKKEAPDLIINAAGFGLYGEILSLPIERQMEILKVNIDALVLFSIEGARALKESKKRGVIMNISSTACFFTYPCFALYAASKEFVKKFSLSFDEELKSYGIRVLTAIPGRFESKFQQRAGRSDKNLTSIWDMSVLKTAKAIVTQIKKKRNYQVIDTRYYLLTCIARSLPRKWMAKILRKGIEKMLFKK